MENAEILIGIENIFERDGKFVNEFLQLFSDDEIRIFHEWEERFKLSMEEAEEFGQDYRIPVVFGFFDVARHSKRLYNVFEYAATQEIDEGIVLDYMQIFKYKQFIHEVAGVDELDNIPEKYGIDISKTLENDTYQIILCDEMLIVVEKNILKRKTWISGVNSIMEVEKWNILH